MAMHRVRHPDIPEGGPIVTTYNTNLASEFYVLSMPEPQLARHRSL